MLCWSSHVVLFLLVACFCLGEGDAGHMVDDAHDLPRSSGPSPWQLTKWERQLVGDGQHRLLYTELILTYHKEAPIPESGGGCEAVLVENLPRGVFADRFELQRLASDEVVPLTEVIGDVDIESPAPMCTGTVLLVHPKLEILPSGAAESAGKVGSGVAEDAWGGGREGVEPLSLRTSASVPLHSRYPETMLRDASGPASWWGGEHDVVAIPPPSVLVRCHGQGEFRPEEGLDWREVELSRSRHCKENVGSHLLWRVPAGNPAHSAVVAVLTGLASLIGASVLILQTMAKGAS